MALTEGTTSFPQDLNSKYGEGWVDFDGNLYFQRLAVIVRNVSAIHTTQVQTIRLYNLHDTLAIQMTASAATASVVVDVSVDNTNWLTLETLAAALTIAKQYTPTTVGAAVALSPLSFPYVRLTVSDPGVGNTTTLTVAVK